MRQVRRAGLNTRNDHPRVGRRQHAGVAPRFHRSPVVVASAGPFSGRRPHAGPSMPGAGTMTAAARRHRAAQVAVAQQDQVQALIDK